MEVRLAAIADFANVDAAGKFNLVGVYETLSSPTFPFAHHLYLALGLTATPAEVGTHKVVRIRVVTPDGEILAEGEIRTTIGPPAQPGRKMYQNFALQFGDLMIPSPGDYQVAILINDEERATVPLTVERKDLPGGEFV